MTSRLWPVALAAALVAVVTVRPDAHKPITSPFTFSADVRPIVRDRCGRCHAPEGVAPMSLLSHVDALPWRESLRLELMSGHMPPWHVDRGADRVHNPGGLTARELNVLLTWVTGGTPPGDPLPDDQAIPTRDWPLGSPDAVLPLPRVTLGADEAERTIEFAIPAPSGAGSIRALDLLPGTPAIVRGATVKLKGRERNVAIDTERLLTLWVPGDDAVPVRDGGLALPVGAQLAVQVRYRKTWEYERREMSDESRVGVYYGPASASRVQRVSLTPGAPVTLPRAARALAVYPDATLSDARVAVSATRPDGRRDELLAFQARPGWARRYWFREPMSLPRGTRLSVRITPSSPALLPPGFTGPPPRRASSSRLFVNVVM